MQLEKILYQIGHVANFGTRTNSTETKSWRALENNAILYSTERCMNGELDYVRLCESDNNVICFTRNSK